MFSWFLKSKYYNLFFFSVCLYISPLRDKCSNDLKMGDKAKYCETELATAKILSGPPKHLQIIKNRLKTSFGRKIDNNVDKFEELSIIRERGQSVTAECCSIGARSVFQNQFPQKISVFQSRAPFSCVDTNTISLSALGVFS